MEHVLRTGKKIVVKELTALEEVFSYQLMGKDFDPDNVVQSALLHRSVQTVLSIAEIDGEKMLTPSSMDQVYATLGKFSAREWKEILVVFDEVNGFGPDELGE